MSTSHYLVLAVSIAFGFGCSVDRPAWQEDPLAEPQAVSLFGEELFALPDTSGAIAAADSALAASPDDVDLIIAAGRVRRNYWQYRQAMALYTRAIELNPDDWRPYRYRGHRHISTRNFGQAIEDLRLARDLAPLNWDVAYHLGLALFLSGEFEAAAQEYVRCLDLADDESARSAQTEDFRSCSQNADDVESYVSMTEWAVRALRRSGQKEKALDLIRSVDEDLPVQVDIAYYHNLLFYKGIKTADELLILGEDAPYRLETVGFGVANWFLVEGDTTRAVEIMEQIAQHPWWPGFGRLAAEAELARLRKPAAVSG